MRNKKQQKGLILHTSGGNIEGAGRKNNPVRGSIANVKPKKNIYTIVRKMHKCTKNRSGTLKTDKIIRCSEK